MALSHIAAMKGARIKPEDFMPQTKRMPSSDGPGIDVYEKWMKAATSGKS